MDVDFEWFNFDADIDYHGVKALLRQLFDADSALFDLSAVTDVILAQSTIGSTVKVDGKENDAYAFLTALSLREQGSKEAIAAIARYLAEKAGTNKRLAPAAELLSLSPDGQREQGKHVALVLSERLINMPVETVPPMYEMLVDEIEAAVEDGEPYEFTHYLVVSKAYKEVESTLDVDEEAGGRKKKKVKAESPLMFFHPEVEVMQKHAVAWGGYEYTREGESSDSKRAFQEAGIKPQGYMVLIEASKFGDAVKAVARYIKQSE